MNERIKQLAEQAGMYDFVLESMGIGEEFEKFALLIVRECLKIVEPDKTSGDEWCVALDETAQSIRQHFGVED